MSRAGNGWQAGDGCLHPGGSAGPLWARTGLHSWASLVSVVWSEQTFSTLSSLCDMTPGADIWQSTRSKSVRFTLIARSCKISICVGHKWTADDVCLSVWLVVPWSAELRLPRGFDQGDLQLLDGCIQMQRSYHRLDSLGIVDGE